MPLRFRANMRMTQKPWANWLKDNFDVIMTHAFHNKPGTSEEELSVNKVSVDGFTFRCDIFWPDDREDLLQQGVDWITDPGVQARIAAKTEEEFSWADYHECKHDLDPPQPCPSPAWSWSS